MSKQTKTISRRHFLKGAAYTSALSMGGLSGAALASSVTPNPFIVTESTSAAVTLVNQSATVVALDINQPVSLEKKNGWVVVKVNKASEAALVQPLHLEAGQKISFSVDAELEPMLTASNRKPVINRTVFVGNDDFPASLYHPTIA